MHGVPNESRTLDRSKLRLSSVVGFQHLVQTLVVLFNHWVLATFTKGQNLGYHDRGPSPCIRNEGLR